MDFEKAVGTVQFDGNDEAFVGRVYQALSVQLMDNKKKPEHRNVKSVQIDNGVQWQTQCACKKLFYGTSRDESLRFFNLHLPIDWNQDDGRHVVKARDRRLGQVVVICACGDNFSGVSEQHAVWQFDNTEHTRMLLNPNWEKPILFEHANYVPKIRRPRIVKMLEGYAERERQQAPFLVEELLSMALSADVLEIEGEDPPAPSFTGPEQELYVAIRIMEMIGLATDFEPLLERLKIKIERERGQYEKMLEQIAKQQTRGQKSSRLLALLRPDEKIEEFRRLDGSFEVRLTQQNGLWKAVVFTRKEMDILTPDKLIDSAIKTLGLADRLSTLLYPAIKVATKPDEIPPMRVPYLYPEPQTQNYIVDREGESRRAMDELSTQGFTMGRIRRG